MAKYVLQLIYAVTLMLQFVRGCGMMTESSFVVFLLIACLIACVLPYINACMNKNEVHYIFI